MYYVLGLCHLVSFLAFDFTEFVRLLFGMRIVTNHSEVDSKLQYKLPQVKLEIAPQAFKTDLDSVCYE